MKGTSAVVAEFIGTEANLGIPLPASSATIFGTAVDARGLAGVYQHLILEKK